MKIVNYCNLTPVSPYPCRERQIRCTYGDFSDRFPSSKLSNAQSNVPCSSTTANSVANYPASLVTPRESKLELSRLASGYARLCSSSINTRHRALLGHFKSVPTVSAFSMASGYDASQYLLDRANIHDTATRIV